MIIAFSRISMVTKERAEKLQQRKSVKSFYTVRQRTNERLLLWLPLNDVWFCLCFESLAIRDIMVCFRLRCVANYYSAATIDLTKCLTSVLSCVLDTCEHRRVQESVCGRVVVQLLEDL